MTTQNPHIHFDRPLATIIRDDQIPHFRPYGLPGACKKALTGCRLLTNKPKIPSCNPCSPKEQLMIMSDILRIYQHKLAVEWKQKLASNCSTANRQQYCIPCEEDTHAETRPGGPDCSRHSQETLYQPCQRTSRHQPQRDERQNQQPQRVLPQHSPSENNYIINFWLD